MRLHVPCGIGFSGISTMYPELTVLKSLLAGLTLSRQADSNQGSVAPAVAPPRSTSPWTVGQLTPFLDRLRESTDSEGGLLDSHYCIGSLPFAICYYFV